MREPHSEPGPSERLNVEFERKLFHPLQVGEGMLKWMAAERQKIKDMLPGLEPKIATLKGLADNEFEDLITGHGLTEAEPVVLDEGGLDRYRQLRKHQPRFPAYIVSDKAVYEKLRHSHELGPEGMADSFNLQTNVYDPGTNQVKFLWTVLGQVHGVRRPILGFMRGEEANGLLYVIEPKTEKYERYLQGLATSGTYDERRQAVEGRKLAELELRAADNLLRPRGACDPVNICVREDGSLYYGNIYFQVTKTPQESMSFAQYEHSSTAFDTMRKLGYATPTFITSYLDTIERREMIDYNVFLGMQADPATFHRWGRMPKAYRDWIEGKSPELPWLK